MEDMFNTLIKLVEGRGAWMKIMFGISLLQAHTSMTMKKKNDLSQRRFALIKVELFEKEWRLLDGIWVKVEIVGKVPQISILIRKTNWVSFNEEGKLIRWFFGFLDVEDKVNP